MTDDIFNSILRYLISASIIFLDRHGGYLRTQRVILCSDKQAWSVYSISLYASEFSFYHYRTIHIHYRSILDIIVTNNVIPMSRAGLV